MVTSPKKREVSKPAARKVSLRCEPRSEEAYADEKALSEDEDEVSDVETPPKKVKKVARKSVSTPFPTFTSSEMAGIAQS